MFVGKLKKCPKCESKNAKIKYLETYYHKKVCGYNATCECKDCGFKISTKDICGNFSKKFSAKKAIKFIWNNWVIFEKNKVNNNINQ